MTNEEAIDILKNIKMTHLKTCLSLARGNGKSFTELERFLKTMQAFDMAIDALGPDTRQTVLKKEVLNKEDTIEPTDFDIFDPKTCVTFTAEEVNLNAESNGDI